MRKGSENFVQPDIDIPITVQSSFYTNRFLQQYNSDVYNLSDVIIETATEAIEHPDTGVMIKGVPNSNADIYQNYASHIDELKCHEPNIPDYTSMVLLDPRITKLHDIFLHNETNSDVFDKIVTTIINWLTQRTNINQIQLGHNLCSQLIMTAMNSELPNNQWLNTLTQSYDPINRIAIQRSLESQQLIRNICEQKEAEYNHESDDK